MVSAARPSPGTALHQVGLMSCDDHQRQPRHHGQADPVVCSRALNEPERLQLDLVLWELIRDLPRVFSVMHPQWPRH